MSRDIDLDHIFTYHVPSDRDVVQYNKLRTGARAFAQIIIDFTPPGADQSASLRKVREAVMTANAAVALNGRLHKPPPVEDGVAEFSSDDL